MKIITLIFIMIVSSTLISAQNSNDELKAFSDINFGIKEKRGSKGNLIAPFTDKIYTISDYNFKVRSPRFTAEDGLWEFELSLSDKVFLKQDYKPIYVINDREYILKAFSEISNVIYMAYGNYKNIQINCEEEVNQYTLSNREIVKMFESASGVKEIEKYFPCFYYREFQKPDVTLKLGYQKFQHTSKEPLEII